MDIRNVAVFCGSNMGDNPVFQERIIMLADSLIQEGWGLVYGGGHRGLMGEISQYMLEHGAEVNVSGNCEYRPLHWAVQRNDTTIAEALKSFEEMYEFNNNIGKSFTDSCNTSTTSDHFPDFVSSSTDDDYGKSTIRHFKSWDEECEGNDCAINDYEGGIKHFQD